MIKEIYFHRDYNNNYLQKNYSSVYFVLFPVVFLFFIFYPLSVTSQVSSSDDYVEEYIVISDSIPDKDSIRFKIKKEDIVKSVQFYDSLRHRAYKNKLLQTIHNFLIVQPDEAIVLNENKLDEIENPFRQHKGKKIEEISIKQLNVFGTSMEDSVLMDVSWYEDFGNWMHISTREIIIRENLLFEEGDHLDPMLLADNERVLRRLGFLKDARVLVNEHPEDTQAVNVTIVTQDLWSKGFNVDLKSINSGDIALFDNNIFGIGHKLQTNIVFDYLKKSNPGFEGYYKMNNLAGTFINGRLFFQDVFEDRHFGLEFSRGFYSYKTDWIGGIKAFRHSTNKNIRKTDTVLYDTHLEYVEHDFWLGYGIPLRLKSNLFEDRNRLVLSARYNLDRFSEGPELDERYNYQYHDNYVFLGNVSFSRQNFYKSSLIYGFGRTEDIPVGDLIGYTFGWEVDEFFHRFYSGIDIKHGQYFSNFGYLSGSLGFGGFYYEKDFEQGVLNFKSKYISKLFNVGDIQWRQFIDINYKYGIDRFPDEKIGYSPANDIRGYKDESLLGDKKLVIRMETVGFTDLYYYGFRIALYGFMDFGFIGPENRFVVNNPVQSGFGLGMRVRNENLVFNTFQLRLGYYPNLSYNHHWLFRISGEKTLAPYRYTPSAPEIIEF